MVLGGQRTSDSDGPGLLWIFSTPVFYEGDGRFTDSLLCFFLSFFRVLFSECTFTLRIRTGSPWQGSDPTSKRRGPGPQNPMCLRVRILGVTYINHPKDPHPQKQGF